jgi:NADH:ubiquinone oxidoreductase subunit E
MNPARVRRAAWISGGIIALCIAVLAVDWAVATWREPKDEAIVKHLQEEVREDPDFAPKLEAENDRITAARLGRRQRGQAIAWILLAAAALFLTAVNHLRAARGRRFIELEALKAPPGPQRKKKQKQAASNGACACPHPDAASDTRFVDELVARHGRGKEAAIPILQAIQTHYRYLPDEALRRVCELTDITPAEISGTSTFYGQFRRSPVGKHIVRVCHGTACHVAGARQISDELRRHLQIPEGEDTDAQRLFTLEEVACLGCCSLAPVLMVDEHTAGRLTPSTAPAALEDVGQGEPA